jgi:hypothetical protein
MSVSLKELLAREHSDSDDVRETPPLSLRVTTPVPVVSASCVYAHTRSCTQVVQYIRSVQKEKTASDVQSCSVGESCTDVGGEVPVPPTRVRHRRKRSGVLRNSDDGVCVMRSTLNIHCATEALISDVGGGGDDVGDSPVPAGEDALDWLLINDRDSMRVRARPACSVSSFSSMYSLVRIWTLNDLLFRTE